MKAPYPVNFIGSDSWGTELAMAAQSNCTFCDDNELTSTKKQQLSLMNIFTGFRNEFCVRCRQRARDLQPLPTAMRDGVSDDVLRVINEKVSGELSRVYKRNMSRYLSLAVASTTNFNGQITQR